MLEMFLTTTDYYFSIETQKPWFDWQDNQYQEKEKENVDDIINNYNISNKDVHILYLYIFVDTKCWESVFLNMDFMLAVDCRASYIVQHNERALALIKHFLGRAKFWRKL